MVKIEEKSGEERELERKCRTLVEITREITAGSDLKLITPGISLGMGLFYQDTPMSSKAAVWIDPSSNKVYVYRGSYFEIAKRLAEAYEAKTKEEFTIKLKY